MDGLAPGPFLVPVTNMTSPACLGRWVVGADAPNTASAHEVRLGFWPPMDIGAIFSGGPQPCMTPPPPRPITMGATAYEGKGSKGRVVNGDRPIGAASCRREQHTKGDMPNPDHHALGRGGLPKQHPGTLVCW